jgi:hypothetical protein
MEQRLCQLEYAVGRLEECPGDACPFWAGHHCAVTPLWPDLATDEHLAELMLGVRADLARLTPHRTFRLFHPPGLA